MSACEPFADVDVSEGVAWISAIPFEDWPQQHRLEDGKVRPAMVSDINWRGFGNAMWPIVRALWFDERNAYQLMLSAVMPGHSIPPHKDSQADYWLYRIHVPLLTDPKSYVKIGGRKRYLKVGKAYKLDTTKEHSVVNEGTGPRVHFMFDVRG